MTDRSAAGETCRPRIWRSCSRSRASLAAPVRSDVDARQAVTAAGAVQVGCAPSVRRSGCTNAAAGRARASRCSSGHPARAHSRWGPRPSSGGVRSRSPRCSTFRIATADPRFDQQVDRRSGLTATRCSLTLPADRSRPGALGRRHGRCSIASTAPFRERRDEQLASRARCFNARFALPARADDRSR